MFAALDLYFLTGKPQQNIFVFNSYCMNIILCC